MRAKSLHFGFSQLATSIIVSNMSITPLKYCSIPRFAPLLCVLPVLRCCIKFVLQRKEDAWVGYKSC